MNHVKNIPKNFYNFQYTWVSSFLCGGGLAWSTQNGNYHVYLFLLGIKSLITERKFYLKEKMNN